MRLKHPWIRNLLIAAAALCLLGCVAVLAINAYVKSAAKPYMLQADEVEEPFDCILILGCGVRANGEPSLMLRDRLDMGLRLFEADAAPKLLMSGDHGSAEYDEVNAMKAYAMDRGVDAEVIFMDHAGFSTYESMYRARDIFCARRIVIVSQKYHLPRAVYNARALGLDAWGVAAEDVKYLGQQMRDVREILARNKDFFWCLFQPEPTFLGDAIPISGSGLLTAG